MKKLFITFALFAIANINFAQVNLDSGLVAKYYFNGNANDESVNSNNGTVSGATLTNDRCDNANSAYSFDGINDRITVPHSELINFENNQDFTFSIWVKSDSTQPISTWIDNYFIDKWNDYLNQPYPYALRLYNQSTGSSNGLVYCARWDGSCNHGSSVTSIHKVNDRSFHHIVFMKQGNNLYLYFDGQLDGNVNDNSICSTKNTNPLIIGSSTPGGNPFKGSLDDIRIYNRALTQLEIDTLFHESCLTRIKEIGSDNGIYLYPNPASNKLTIELQQANLLQSTTLSIYYIQGQLLLHRPLQQTKDEIDISTLAKGVYILKLNNTEKTAVTRFVKE